MQLRVLLLALCVHQAYGQVGVVGNSEMEVAGMGRSGAGTSLSIGHGKSPPSRREKREEKGPACACTLQLAQVMNDDFAGLCPNDNHDHCLLEEFDENKRIQKGMLDSFHKDPLLFTKKVAVLQECLRETLTGDGSGHKEYLSGSDTAMSKKKQGYCQGTLMFLRKGIMALPMMSEYLEKVPEVAALAHRKLKKPALRQIDHDKREHLYQKLAGIKGGLDLTKQKHLTDFDVAKITYDLHQKESKETMGFDEFGGAGLPNQGSNMMYGSSGGALMNEDDQRDSSWR